MTNLQGKKVNEPVMGRADVLFRFLQLIGKDRPNDLNVHLEKLNVRDPNRPIVDQLVDVIIAGDKELYERYEQARREVGSRNPYGSAEDQSEQHAYELTLGFFLSKWITFETAIRAMTEKILGDYKTPLPQLFSKLQLFPDEDIRVVDYIRKLRNELVHGRKAPEAQYIVEAGKLLDDLVAKLRERLPEDSRNIIEPVLQNKIVR